MKTFEITCIIYDKYNPNIPEENIVEIQLTTIVEDESAQFAIDKILLLYNVKEIINIQEIL